MGETGYYYWATLDRMPLVNISDCYPNESSDHFWDDDDSYFHTAEEGQFESFDSDYDYREDD